MRVSLPFLPPPLDYYSKAVVVAAEEEEAVGKKAPLSSVSDAACCAERRLLATAAGEARRHGVAPHAVVAWVRRKHGGDVAVVRPRGPGRGDKDSHGTSVPCVMCRRALIAFGMRVHCCTGDGAWFHGHLDEPGAPPSVPTSGQARAWMGHGCR
jgi:hypothetical protein